MSAALEVVRRRAIGGLPCRPSANLELDLGLDSMERVELLTELEQEFGVHVAEEQTHQIFTLGQLIDAVRPGAATATGATGAAAGTDRTDCSRRRPAESSRGVSDESWAVLLRDLPPATDPVLSGLLAPRPISSRCCSWSAGCCRACSGPCACSGLDKLPKDGAFLICPNHQSYVDPFFVCGVLPYRTLARAFFVGAVEYFETPLMSWVARKLHCVPVDPDSNLVPAMKAGAFGLAHGKVLILFPEGERSIDGTVKRFKKGAPILSRHLGVPVVPVAIEGAHDVWPRGRSFNWRGLLPWSRSHVSVQFGDPIQFTEGESYADAAARLRATRRRHVAAAGDRKVTAAARSNIARYDQRDQQIIDIRLITTSPHQEIDRFVLLSRPQASSPARRRCLRAPRARPPRRRASRTPTPRRSSPAPAGD